MNYNTYLHSERDQRDRRNLVDFLNINRECGWIARVINGQLVKVARVTTTEKPAYIPGYLK